MNNIKNSAVDNTDDEIDLRQLFSILLDSKWLIISFILLFAALGLAFAQLSSPIFKADALIQIEKKSSGGISAMVGDMGELFSSEASCATEMELLKSRMILGDTVDKFNLTTIVTPLYLPVIGKGIARINNSQHYLTLSKFDVPSHVTGLTHEMIITDSEKGHFQLLLNDKIVLSGQQGKLIEKNGYKVRVNELISNNDDRFSINKVSKLDAINTLTSKLSITEKGAQTGIISLSIEGEQPQLNQAILNDVVQNYFLQNVRRNSAEAEQSLTFLTSHLPKIKEKLNSSEDLLNQFRQQNESIDLNLEAQSTLKVMVELEAQLNQLTFKESDISQKFTLDHPAYKSLLDKRKTLLQEKQRLNKQIQKLPKTQREILRMTRDVEVNQQIYIQLLNKVQELTIIKAGTVGNVRIIDSAQSYALPVKPKKPLIVVLSTLLGAMLSIAFVLVRAAFKRGLLSPEEIEQKGMTVYASIPKSLQQLEIANRLKRKTPSNSPLLAEANPADLSMEALRGLRTSLHFAMMEAKNNVLMISGPAPSIGKTFVSTNFAAITAKTGQKVLLIDADMRKGYLHQCFKSKNELGLSDFLSGKVCFEETIKHSNIDNLDIITRGQTPPNPSELLMHRRFTEFVEQASSRYDLVIIDTPPILAVTDPCIVGSLAGTTLMVARFEKTTARELEAAKNRFEQSGIEVKGIIFNAIEKKAASAHSYGYYNYAYKSD
ncbi:tyrosine-protein kinase [Vibrio azureus]|nr:tyrosine-protein kinase [Vibrio azureus]